MKIKKITALLLGLCSAFAFAACDDEPTTNGGTPTHTHAFATEWSNDETHHWYACTGSGCKETSQKAEHAFDDGEITTPASASQEGVKTFTCQDCGATKTEPVEYVPDTEVTAEEWAAALELNFDNYTMTQEMKYGGETQRIAVVVDDGLIYHNGEQELYLTKEGDVYYEYVCEDNEWHKYSVTESYYNGYADASLASGFIFEDFTYNAETKAYECATASAQGITNATLTFSDNKLTSATFTMGPVQASMTLTYGDAEITLPQTVPSKKIKDDNMLASAFSAALDLMSERTIYLAMYDPETNTENPMWEVRVTENLVYTNMPYYEQVYELADDGEIYEYMKQSGQSWTKTHRTGALERPWEYLVNAAVTMGGHGEYAAGASCLEEMTYNATEKCYMYTAVYDEEYNAQADYQAYFLDGKLVKLEVFQNGVKWLVFTYDYEVEEIQIPEV